MSTEEQKANLFNLTIGSDEDNKESVEGRADAVARAKSLSQETNQRVSLERADGMVSMQFSDGVLETYVCETREKKAPRRKSDTDQQDAVETDFEEVTASDEAEDIEVEDPQTEETAETAEA